MQGDTAEELNIVVYHFPFQVVSTCRPMVVIDGLVAVDGHEVLAGVGCQLAVEVGCGNDCFFVFGKSPSRVLDDAECGGHHLVQRFLVNLQRLFLQLVYLFEDGFALIDGRFFNFALQFGNLVFLFFGGVLYILLYLLGLGTQFVVAQLLNVGIGLLHRLHERLYQTHVSA